MSRSKYSPRLSDIIALPTGLVQAGAARVGEGVREALACSDGNPTIVIPAILPYLITQAICILAMIPTMLLKCPLASIEDRIFDVRSYDNVFERFYSELVYP